jgi:PAS domain S-box-containing protein
VTDDPNPWTRPGSLGILGRMSDMPALLPDPFAERLSLLRLLSAPTEDAPPDPYRAFVDALGVALYTTDAEGRLTYYNDAAAELWGRRPEYGELWCGSWHLFWLDGSPMAHEECPMAITLKEGRPVRGAAAIAERPDGSRVHFQPYPSPLLDDAGQLVGGVNVLIDVSERYQAQQDLEATEEALTVSISARDDFLGLVSHELRTPVTTIFGNAQLLLGRTMDLNVREREMVTDIATDSERLLAIVENLLLLARLQAGANPDLEPLILNHAIRQEVDGFRKRYPERSIEISEDGAHVLVESDGAYLMLLIQNLLSNAHKYGGTQPIDVTIEHDDHEARVSVMDRGLGIDDATFDELAVSFYRGEEAQRVAGGVGLGLSVCARIVALMGGRMWASPRDGGGSVFGFAIPLSPSAGDD